MKKILVVDDEPDVNLTLKVTLEDKGFIADTFDDPLLALQNFRAGQSYDLLILDVKMPKMNGFELYREIRKINDKVKVCFLQPVKCIMMIYIQTYLMEKINLLGS